MTDERNETNWARLISLAEICLFCDKMAARSNLPFCIDIWYILSHFFAIYNRFL